MSNPFYKNHGPLKISEIVKSFNIKINNSYLDKEINDIKDLYLSTQNDITFFIQKNIKMLQVKLRHHFV